MLFRSIRVKINRYLTNEVHLRSKRELIERFLNENLLQIEDEDDIESKFFEFWDAEKTKAIEFLSQEENLDTERVQQLIGNYLFTEKIPLRDEIIETMNCRPSLKERKTVAERVLNKIKRYIETFIEGL